MAKKAKAAKPRKHARPGSQDRERYIFRYHDGLADKAADPMAAWLALEGHSEFVPDRDMERLAKGDATAIPPTVAAAREAFTLPTLADGGLTDLECLELLTRFYDFLGELKKSTGLFLTSRRSMEPASSVAGSTVPTATNTSSDSGSIASEPISDSLPQ